MKETEPQPQVRRTAIAILNYLCDHPRAKDTAQGIAKFWLGESEEVVTDALALLIAEHAIEKRGQVYQLTRSVAKRKQTDWLDNMVKRLN